MDCHRNINRVGIGLVMRSGCRGDWFYVGWKAGRAGTVVLVILVCATNVVGGWRRTMFWMKIRCISGKLYRSKCEGRGAAGFERTDSYVTTK